jgi:putative sigma-54 modulation protein
MQVNVTFRNTKPTDGLREHAIEKVERASKFMHRPIDAHVILSVVKRRHIAEVLVAGKNLNLTAKEETGDLYSAIDLAVSKLERQAKKHAGKVKSHKGISSTSAPPPLAASKPLNLPRTRKVAVKAMSVEDAAAEFDRADAEFFFFENAASGALLMIYRRKDGKFGLIEPEMS